MEVDTQTRLPVRFRFIDLGTNTLYSRQAGVADHDDAIFVAPEVKRRSREATSDLYSLAVILTELLSGSRPRDGMVPEAVWTLSPELGRLLEDALDVQHSRRLLLASGEVRTFATIKRDFGQTFELVSAEPAASEGRFSELWTELAPASGSRGPSFGNIEGLSRERPWRATGAFAI